MQIHQSKSCKPKHKVDELGDINDDAKLLICEMENKIKEYEKILKENSLTINNINNTNNTNNITNVTNNNVTNIDNSQNVFLINTFKKEDLSYLTDDECRAIIDSVFRSAKKYAELVHFNKQHPENHNLLLTNTRSKYMKIRKDDKWHKALTTDVLEDIIDIVDNFLSDKYDELEDTLDHFTKRRAKKYMKFDKDASAGNKKTYRKIIADLKIYFYNNQDMKNLFIIINKF